jgi:hypothetical protein
MKKRHIIKDFFSNKWVYGILLALLPSVFNRLLALKLPAMDHGILRNIKRFFAIKFTLVIPIWLLLSAGLVTIFILARLLVFRNRK